MENLSRNFEHELRRGISRDIIVPKRSWDVLLIDDQGQIRRFKHFRLMMISMVLLMCLFGLAAAMLGILYQSERGQRQDLEVRLSRVESESGGMHRQMQLLAARVALTEQRDPLVSSTESEEETIRKQATSHSGSALKEKSKPDSIQPSEPVGISESVRPPKRTDNTPAESVQLSAETSAPGGEAVIGSPVENGSVDIADFALSRDAENNVCRTRFVISNKTKNGQNITGYIFMMFTSEANSQEKPWIVPTASFSGGRPDSVDAGQFFSISHYKTVRFRFEPPDNFRELNKLSVQVYNASGDVIFLKEFPVKW